MKSSTLRRVAAFLGLAGVALGAFGAHGLKPQLLAGGTLEAYHTAVFYHLLHTVVLLFLSLRASSGRCVWLFLGGTFLFSGSLYLYAVTLLRPLAFVTPFGGLVLLAGWLWLALEREPAAPAA